jgi:hypothetical protein
MEVDQATLVVTSARVMSKALHIQAKQAEVILQESINGLKEGEAIRSSFSPIIDRYV